jgi:hypothetical protein
MAIAAEARNISTIIPTPVLCFYRITLRKAVKGRVGLPQDFLIAPRKYGAISFGTFRHQVNLPVSARRVRYDKPLLVGRGIRRSIYPEMYQKTHQKRQIPLQLCGRISNINGLRKYGAGEGNRTLVFSLEGCCSTIELHPLVEPCTSHGSALIL